MKYRIRKKVYNAREETYYYIDVKRNWWSGWWPIGVSAHTQEEAEEMIGKLLKCEGPETEEIIPYP